MSKRAATKGRQVSWPSNPCCPSACGHLEASWRVEIYWKQVSAARWSQATGQNKMAETYLQRKFLTKIRSSKSATTSQILSQPPIKRWPTSSQLVDSQSSSRESAMSPGPCQLSSSMSASQLSTAAISPTASLSAESDQHAGEPSKRSRLRSATKAIFFFRRAGGLLTRPDSTQSDQQANFWTHQRPHKKLVRQQTTDSSTAPNQPQFIVPLTNALKLPLVCLIRSVDGELMREVFVHRYELGSYLIESLKVSFGISDCKYFGLKMARSPDDQDDLRNVWLDMDVAVCKQVSKLGINPTSDRQQSIDFYLRIKFYPPSLARIQEPFVRHYLWLQLRRDLRLGKLTSSMNNLTYLMACVLQYEFGDHSQDQLERVPQLQILPNQDLVEHHAIELWRDQLKGSLRHQSQMQFLRAAVILETYGFDYYPVRDHQRQRAYLLGFNYAGVKTIRNGRIAHHFRWQSISKISNERRMIIFHVSPNESSRRKQILGFKCLSNEDCQCLYLRLVEQKVFFT